MKRLLLLSMSISIFCWLGASTGQEKKTDLEQWQEMLRDTEITDEAFDAFIKNLSPQTALPELFGTAWSDGRSYAAYAIFKKLNQDQKKIFANAMIQIAPHKKDEIALYLVHTDHVDNDPFYDPALAPLPSESAEQEQPVGPNHAAQIFESQKTWYAAGAAAVVIILGVRHIAQTALQVSAAQTLIASPQAFAWLSCRGAVNDEEHLVQLLQKQIKQRYGDKSLSQQKELVLQAIEREQMVLRAYVQAAGSFCSFLYRINQDDVKKAERGLIRLAHLKKVVVKVDGEQKA